MTIYRLPFDDDAKWHGGANWDDPGGGHGPFQAYAFDVGHPTGGTVRAAREGVVLFATGDRSCNVTGKELPEDPCFGAKGEGNVVLITHPDKTVAAYCHLEKDQVFVHKGQWVPQGFVIAHSGNTGHSSGPHLHFEVRMFVLDTDDVGTPIGQGPTIPVQFEDQKHVAWRPKGGDAFASNNTVFRREGWKRCHQCQGLFYGSEAHQGAGVGACPLGGRHHAVGTRNYILVFNSRAPGQSGWKLCSKCQCVFFAKNSGSKCPAGGGIHTSNNREDYVLLNNVAEAPGQKDWRWCNKCQGLFFNGNGQSKCPAGGPHIKIGSGDYSLVSMGPGEAEADWRCCNKCQGLFFGSNLESPCPAKGTHNSEGSRNLILARDYLSGNAPGEEGWRCCSKCQGLFFDVSNASRCPAGGSHSQHASGHYTLVKNSLNAPGQQNWAHCVKCQGLFFVGSTASRCPAGGAHLNTEIREYCLLF